MNKKALITFNIVKFLLNTAFLIIALTVILLLISSYINLSVDTNEAEADLFVSRLMYMQGGLSYYDKDIQRLYPGVIDKSLFEPVDAKDPDKLKGTEQLAKNIYFGGEERIFAKITLADPRGTSKTIYFEEALFKKSLPFEGGSFEIIRKFPVLVRGGDNLERANINIEVRIP